MGQRDGMVQGEVIVSVLFKLFLSVHLSLSLLSAPLFFQFHEYGGINLLPSCKCCEVYALPNLCEPTSISTETKQRARDIKERRGGEREPEKENGTRPFHDWLRYSSANPSLARCGRREVGRSHSQRRTSRVRNKPEIFCRDFRNRFLLRPTSGIALPSQRMRATK